MNKTEREKIAYHYKVYCHNRANGDPVGGYEDMRDLFKDLANGDAKLAEEFKEIESEIFNAE
ncbi:MAG: hypothetical protein HDR88_10110 [Bacteroides sp.]|nr:hypothetical protein [Bacteroides sp.]